VSANLDLVRSIYADWERGDFSRADWADPEIEFVLGDGPDPGTHVGLQAMAERWREQLTPWKDLNVDVDDYRDLDEERVLVCGRMTGRGKSGGVLTETSFINVLHVRKRRVTRLVLYWDRDRALADLGLEA
jgi:ketosteroid isomerase-like protein